MDNRLRSQEPRQEKFLKSVFASEACGVWQSLSNKKGVSKREILEGMNRRETASLCSQ